MAKQSHPDSVPTQHRIPPGPDSGVRPAVERTVRTALLQLGIDVRRKVPYRSNAARRQQLIEKHGIDLVLDGGANVGQYATELRDYGYDGRIVCFEPSSAALETLRETAAALSGDVDISHFALSDQDGETTLNIAGNSVSSSLMQITDTHVDSAPTSGTTGTETVEAVRIDSIHHTLIGDATAPMLKLDLQGHELAALRGAPETLPTIRIVEAELSLVELYEGQPLLPEVFDPPHRRRLHLLRPRPRLHRPRDRPDPPDERVFRQGLSLASNPPTRWGLVPADEKNRCRHPLHVRGRDAPLGRHGRLLGLRRLQGQHRRHLPHLRRHLHRCRRSRRPDWSSVAQEPQLSLCNPSYRC